MNQETRSCKSCGNNFVIEPDDFGFYERIKVPPPTQCPECRMKRRMLFRNEFNMHKCKCALCGKETISHYSSRVKFPIYCQECWWSDKWDPLNYGREYDPAKNFFSQWLELSNVVPRPNLEAYQNENSPYSDFTWFCKNIYLSPSALHSENVIYSKMSWNSRDVGDSLFTLNCEKVYQVMDSERCVNCDFVSDSKDCIDSSFLFDCRNSSECFMSSNLRNRKFVFRNEQLSEEEYQKRLMAIGRGAKTYFELIPEYIRLREKALHKFANTVKSVNSSGNNLSQCKNARHCFNAENCEDVKYGVQMSQMKDSQDLYGAGDNTAVLVYDGVNVGYLDSNNYFCSNTFENCARVQYCDYCRTSQDLFGSIGLRKKQYCILNKHYDKEKYEKLRDKIVDDMSENPFVDSRGNVYKYGEFFPPEFSPFAYNEAATQSFFPLNKDEAIRAGYGWMDSEAREYSVTVKAKNLPDTIQEIDDDILNEVIGCEHEQKCGHGCTFAFKIVPQELQFYRKMILPIPWLCPNCRHGERAALRNPIKLWQRACMCDKANHSHRNKCLNGFETSYSPDRPEIVYCESCYNSEVA
ncbi:MAG: hypothetical protein V1856_03545 [Candidatus Liptonbacteria bacterium]